MSNPEMFPVVRSLTYTVQYNLVYYVISHDAVANVDEKAI